MRILAPLAVLLSSLQFLSTAPNAQSWPSKVTATYKISLAGIDIGRFNFASRVSGGAYTLEGDAQFSALFGAFQWRGATKSAGIFKKSRPAPKAYAFGFQSSHDRGELTMNFARDAVVNVQVNPPLKVVADAIPVRARHLRNVMDPMTALFAMSGPAKTAPCDRSLAVFDGKLRFDLKLTFGRTEQLDITRGEKVASQETTVVCQVKFIPVAGYRPTEESRRMAEKNDIELVLRPVPRADLFVPYEVRVPTLLGVARLTTERVDIVAQGNKEIALVH